MIQQATLAQDGDSIAAATAGAIALGRVYTATSLPSHIWSLNGKFISLVLYYWIWALYIGVCVRATDTLFFVTVARRKIY